jgi:hypothetical protein
MGRKILGLALIATLGLSGCAVQGLSFMEDDRINIIRPAENERLRLPFDVRWTVKNFDGLFALFFDRSPMRPNMDLRSLVSEDDPCISVPGCPDAEWLENHGPVYVTDQRILRVDALPDPRDNDRLKERHQLTIVLLDRTGRRLGESAFITDFSVEREDR